MPSNIPASATSDMVATDSSLSFDGSLAIDFAVDAAARRVLREGVSALNESPSADGVWLCSDTAALPFDGSHSGVIEANNVTSAVRSRTEPCSRIVSVV
jgi:hypothetical protein